MMKKYMAVLHYSKNKWPLSDERSNEHELGMYCCSKYERS